MTDEAPKKKRKTGKLPGARTMEAMRKEGFVCGVVERWNQYVMVRQDLFGFCDIIAMSPTGGIIAVQATSDHGGGHGLDRVRKILAEPRAKTWLQSGGRIQVWAWRKLLVKGVERWKPKVTEIKIEHFHGHVIGDPIEKADGLFAGKAPEPVSAVQDTRPATGLIDQLREEMG